MSDVSRREALGILAAVPLATVLETSPASAERAVRVARRAAGAKAAGRAVAPEFFTEHELRTVTVLADLVIPRDARSGSASDAGVPAFIDFMMTDRPSLQIPVRGGLRWLDAESLDRFGQRFVELGEARQKSILDDIAYPARARPEMSHGVAFFNTFRDLVATGFWTSELGMADLQYMGNTYVAEWNGCPEPALRKLGVDYGLMGER